VKAILWLLSGLEVRSPIVSAARSPLRYLFAIGEVMAVRLSDEQKEAVRLNGLHHCILFTYTHGQLTEGFAAELLGLDRLEFRDRWMEFLQQKPEIAKAAGYDTHLKVNE
jgi:hypothetical protein